MEQRRKKGPREKDLTSRYFSGGLDEDRIDKKQRFSDRNAHAQQNKTMQTTLMRAAEADQIVDIESLPIGEVIQVHSLFSDVEFEGVTRLCVMRKTLSKTSDTSIVVGDKVRFRDVVTLDSGRLEAVIEQILPRSTILTRTDSFKAREQHPIVANAAQMLIVASIVQPDVKWGLVDRMIVAAQGGGLAPVICLNKIDLADPKADEKPTATKWREFCTQVMAHYAHLGLRTIQTSAEKGTGLDELKDVLRDKVTVLAGHSGVGKSSLIRSIQPALDIRVGAISGFNDKGRHTTSSAKRYMLTFGGAVVDTPGVKLFGLWGVTRDNIREYFPDIVDGSAPEWRKESFERIRESVTQS